MPVVKRTLRKKSLEQKVEENTSSSIGTKKDAKVIKEGTPCDHSDIHNINKNPKTVGVAVGATFNMGDFNSFRVDCWLTDELQEGETQEEGLQRLAEICKLQVQKQIEEQDK